MGPSYKDTITLEDAARIASSPVFNLMIKPVGSICNLDCAYCYYLDKSLIYGGKEPRMSQEMLRTCIFRYVQACPQDAPLTFNWHGGEPMTAGLDFYKAALEFEREAAPGRQIQNTIQTNATLMTPEWASFLRDEDFLVGVSIDGPRDLHDRYRKDKGGAPTWERVMRGIEMMYRAGVKYNTMTTVNKESSGRGVQVYEFLKSIGSHFMQFMPVVEHVIYPLTASGKENKGGRPIIVDPSREGARLAPWSVPAIGYGRFMCDIFDRWVLNDVGRYYVNLFDSTLAGWVGAAPGTCVYAPTCGGNSIIEHNGDVYCCDHFVYPEYKLGNIATDDLGEMMSSAKQIKFGIGKRNELPVTCMRCQWLKSCHGECPKHRFNTTEAGQTGLNALCEGYKLFFSHVAPYMDYMAERLRQEQAPAAVMAWARTKAPTRSR